MSIARELRELRVRVLQLYYDLTKGNSLNVVYLPVLTEKLGIDSKDIKLLGTIQYLDDKGFLEQTGSPVEVVRITYLGIDEVEFGFPDLLNKRRIP